MAMQRLRSILARVREAFGRRRIADELDEELRLHLEMEVEYNIAHGMSPADARRAATLAFGGVERFREETRESRGFVAVERVLRDLRFTLRRFRRTPAFTVGAIATLSIGLGAATGIGALVYGVMLRPLPYPDPDRLVRVSILTPGFGSATTGHSPGTLAYFTERARSFTQLGGYYENDGMSITDGDQPEPATAAMVTPSVFRILQTSPALGRLFSDADARADTLPVLVSYDIWQRRFGGDSNVIGRRIEVNRFRRVIAGVLPKDFDFPSRATAIWFPSSVGATRAGLNDRYITGIARLRPGVSVREAESELATLVPHLADRFPELATGAVEASGLRATVTPLRAAIVAPVRGELTLLGLMVGIVLLIATANVGTLFLLRAQRLSGEIAVSRALGASRAAIIQRFVIEGMVAAVAGGLVALPIAAVALSTKFGFAAGEIPRLHDVRLSVGVIVALAAATVAIGLSLGLATAARTRAGSAATVLRDDRRSVSASRAWRRAQQGLVALQIAMALALLLAAALMGESLMKLRRVNIGFNPRQTSVFGAPLPFSAYSRYQKTVALHFEVMRSLADMPGVTGVAAAMQLPLTPQTTPQRVETDGDATRTTETTVAANVVSPNYFSVMGIPMRTGRAFAPGDFANATPAVIISASLAQELFGRSNPLGRVIRIAASPRFPAYRVIGVVGDVHGERLQDGVVRVLYFPLLADLAPEALDGPRIPFNPSVRYIVRGDSPLATLAPAFRRIVASIDPRVPVAGATTLDVIVASATVRTRLTMLLLAIAALATVFLGAIGLYSVIAYAVVGRASEFGVRLALGATPDGIVAMVFREGVLLVGVGLLAGAFTSLAGARLVQSVLYEVSALNPIAYACAAGVVLAAAAAAMYIPARAAGRTDPVRALRGG
jgi:putative ABC transport system permease protein